MHEADGVWDPATLANLRSHDRTLVIGNPAFMPWVTQIFQKMPDMLVSTRRIQALEEMERNGDLFHRVIIGREIALSHEHLLAAGRLLGANIKTDGASIHDLGLLVYQPQDEGSSWQFRQSFEFHFPTSRIWEFRSTFGPMIVSEPVGNSWAVFV